MLHKHFNGHVNVCGSVYSCVWLMDSEWNLTYQDTFGTEESSEVF